MKTYTVVATCGEWDDAMVISFQCKDEVLRAAKLQIARNCYEHLMDNPSEEELLKEFESDPLGVDIIIFQGKPFYRGV